MLRELINSIHAAIEMNCLNGIDGEKRARLLIYHTKEIALTLDATKV